MYISLQPNKFWIYPDDLADFPDAVVPSDKRGVRIGQRITLVPIDLSCQEQCRHFCGVGLPDGIDCDWTDKTIRRTTNAYLETLYRAE